MICDHHSRWLPTVPLLVIRALLPSSALLLTRRNNGRIEAPLLMPAARQDGEISFLTARSLLP